MPPSPPNGSCRGGSPTAIRPLGSCRCCHRASMDRSLLGARLSSRGWRVDHRRDHRSTTSRLTPERGVLCHSFCMKRVLLTGMSGPGKSTVIRHLAELGYKAIDTDDGFSEWVPLPRRLASALFQRER